MYTYRGDEFRPEFSHLGELRSVLPNYIHFITTTATATKRTFSIIQNKLFLQNPVIIALPPENPNIYYEVDVTPDLSCFTDRLISDLCQQRREFPKTLIFCRKYSDCTNLYLQIRNVMDVNFTEPPGKPDIHAFRLCDMFHSAATSVMKERVLKTFSAKDSKLRVVIATTAFGLGIDIPDIRQIIHFGPPNDLDSYIQETGRGARDDKYRKAILLYKPNKYTNNEMKEYASHSKQCRRVKLFNCFIKGDSVKSRKPGCSCCDNCAAECNCVECVSH